MRRFPTVLTLSLLASVASSHAHAECQCTCSGGQPVGVCSQPYERPPICQQLCTPSVSRGLPSPALGGPIAPGAVYGNAGGLPADLGAAARQFGVGSPRGPSSAVLPP